MSEQYTLHLVTGAPGTGKSLSAQTCVQSQRGFLSFDMDALIDSASALAQRDIHFAPETWVLYNSLWLDVLKAVLENGMEAVLFTPIAPADISTPPGWCREIRWLQLDCADQVLSQRLSDRRWSDDRIRDALADAQELRQSGIHQVIRTDELDHLAVADAISDWLT